ncbi:MAG: NADPH-dependent FMN reductase [Anaerolineaceae bacterium]|nr:NADPH-dependent FMN reductase [Anaerolineaceae bacterium]
MASQVNILGLSGSLRRDSYNSALLRTANELLPEGAALEVYDLGSIPLYNEDIRQDGFPPAVQALREKIRSADAVLITTPEYNFSFPGVLKNAIDWISRPPDNPFAGKAAAIAGASTGMYGTARAQQQLRQVLSAVNLYTVNKPEVLVTKARETFDQNGRLADETARKFYGDLLGELVRFARRLKGE